MWTYNNTDELYHHGILGMKWGHRKAERDSQGNLTKYGAKKLAKDYNKIENTNRYSVVKYKDKQRKKNYMVYRSTDDDIEYAKRKARVNAILAGPLGGALITSVQYNKRMHEKFDNKNGIGPNLGNKPIRYTTHVKIKK